MHRILRLLAASLWIACGLTPTRADAASAAPRVSRPRNFQETGFLNRTITVHDLTYHFQIYLPEEWRRDDHKLWPIILFLHGRGERGSEGMWQTQIGLPAEVRDHPERWPFIIVMPQCPDPHYWTDLDMMAMALATLDQETAEFHADPARTYLTGLSLGGYGAWELARLNPKRWAAMAIAAGGIFWSYAPERWSEAATLPTEYAHALGRTPIWLFHGSDDPIVPPREYELMFAAFKADGGNIHLWVYQGLKHDCWSRAFNEPDLPRWMLSHHLEPRPESPSFAERLVIPLHPLALRLTPAQLESFAGEFHDAKRSACRHNLSPGRPALPEKRARRDCRIGCRVPVHPLLSQRRQYHPHQRRARCPGTHYRSDPARRPPPGTVGTSASGCQQGIESAHDVRSRGLNGTRNASLA